MTATIKGRIKALSIDKTNGETYGFSLDKVDGYFNYSKPEYRETPWDKHAVGNIIECVYVPQEQADGKTKRWVKSISRLDEEEEIPEWAAESVPMGEAITAANERKAEKVAEVLSAEGSRERSIERQVAIKCAAEVAVAMIPYIHAEDGSTTISVAQVGVLIDKLIGHFRKGLE